MRKLVHLCQLFLLFGIWYYYRNAWRVPPTAGSGYYISNRQGWEPGMWTQGGRGRYSSDGRASVLYSECRGFEACYRLQTAVPCCTVRTRTWHCRMSVLNNDASASGGCIRSRAQNMAGSFQEAGACTGAVFRTATVTVPRKPERPGAFFKKGWWNGCKAN